MDRSLGAGLGGLAGWRGFGGWGGGFYPHPTSMEPNTKLLEYPDLDYILQKGFAGFHVGPEGIAFVTSLLVHFSHFLGLDHFSSRQTSSRTFFGQSQKVGNQVSESFLEASGFLGSEIDKAGRGGSQARPGGSGCPLSYFLSSVSDFHHLLGRFGLVWN